MFFSKIKIIFTRNEIPDEIDEIQKNSRIQEIVARFLALVTTMVTKVDHGN